LRQLPRLIERACAHIFRVQAAGTEESDLQYAINLGWPPVQGLAVADVELSAPRPAQVVAEAMAIRLYRLALLAFGGCFMQIS
jgi:hypothetical protein